MRAEVTMEFPYKHSTGETIGRFLAGLKEQQKIWGQRVAGQGVVVPPLGYSEDRRVGGRRVGRGAAHRHRDRRRRRAEAARPPAPVRAPFAFVLVKLDGADTALAHIVIDGHDRVQVGSRVEAVWADERTGTIRDIARFRLVG